MLSIPSWCGKTQQIHDNFSPSNSPLRSSVFSFFFGKNQVYEVNHAAVWYTENFVQFRKVASSIFAFGRAMLNFGGVTSPWFADGYFVHLGVSENGGTPKSSILIGFSIINHPFWGTPIFGNTHLFIISKFNKFKHLRHDYQNPPRVWNLIPVNTENKWC